MVADALVQFVPITETTFDSIPLSHLSDINIFPSHCEAFAWVLYMLSYAGSIEVACKQAHFIILTLYCGLNSA